MKPTELSGRPTVQGLSVVDFHVHFRMNHDELTQSLAGGQFSDCGQGDSAGQRAVTTATAATSARWRRSWDFADPEGAEHDHGWQAEADRWVAELSAHSVEHANFVTAGGDAKMHELVAHAPHRFTGMAAMKDPYAPGAAQAFETAIVEHGLVGLKLFAPLMSERIDSTDDAVWRVAARNGVPIVIHFGHCGSAGGIAHNEFSNPAWLEAVAKRYPEITFVIPHFGIQHVQEVLFLMWACPNVVVDTSGSNQWVRYMASKLTLDDLFRRFYETMGSERIVFGSDSSWFPRGFARRYLVDQLRICWEMGMTASDLQNIFGANAARLLKIDGWMPADPSLSA